MNMSATQITIHWREPTWAEEATSCFDFGSPARRLCGKTYVRAGDLLERGQ